MYVQSITLGADPELFIIDTSTNKVVSSVGLIPGVKDHPYVSEDMPEGFGIETDNILAEFNIPPCRTIEEWIHNIEYMKNYIRCFVKRINPNYDIKCSAYEIVDEDQLQTPEAQLLGCDPDYNVYTMRANPKPDAKNAEGRGAGFHIHCGYANQNIKTSLDLIKYFDAYVGLTSLLHDSDVRRRNFYGKAGSFRLQPWGFEYRSLSSAMMKTPELIEFVYNQAMKAISGYNNSFILPDSSYINTAINNGDVGLAAQLIKKYRLLY